MYQQDVWMPTLARAVRVEWPTVGARSQDLRVLTSTVGGPSHMSPGSEDGLVPDSSSDRPQLCLSSSWLRLGLLCSSALPGPLPNASEQAKRIAGRDVGDGNGRRPRLGTFSSPDPSGTEMDAGGRLRLGGSTGNPGLPIDASDRRSAVERRGRRSHWLGVRPAMFDVDA